MIKNYFKIAFRNLWRHKSFSLLNIAGLAIGMASSILILLWVQNERSYDRFHNNADNIYRITVEADGGFGAAVNPAGMPAELQAKIPAIKNTVRLSHPSTNVFQYGDNSFEEKRGFYADSTFLHIFSFPLVAGDRATAMNRPDAILISEDLAKKYFGDTEPIGQSLKKNNQELLTVTGILANVPSNSHLQFDYIMPMSAIANTNEDLINNTWDNYNFYSYILLDERFAPTAANLAALEKQMDDIYKSHIDEQFLKMAFHAQPLTAIHLHSALQIELPGNGNAQYVNTLFVVAIFILIVACINFMNLSTARSARRAKEVGMRKVVGAARVQIMGQFLGESLLISFLSLLIAIGLVYAALPAFNYLAGKTLAISLFDGKLLLMMIGIIVLTGLLAGSYPALFLSGFKPIEVLKGRLKLGGSGNLVFRNTLVVLQFVVSIVLLIGTAVVYEQLSYIKNRNIGYNKSNLLYIPMKGDIWNKQAAYRSELERNPLTADFAITNELPTNLFTGSTNIQWEGKDPNSQIVVPNLDVSEDFFAIFQMELAAGRAFSTDFKGDSSNYIINEKLAGIMGLNAATAVGKPITMWDRQGTIVGVVKDFNFKPIQQPIEPLIMRLNSYGGIVVVRTQPGATEATINALEKINATLNPSFPFSYNFVDQDLDNLYQGEQRLAKLVNLFAVLAVLISCLGLYGLSAFMAEQRFKEIGIRKVLGASVVNVVYLLSRNFIGLLAIAIVIAAPVAWYAMDNWLNGFAYRIDIGWMVLAAASLVAVVIALLTVSYESIKAAIANPVNSLRNE
ncbi:ABC transporter permease [Parapedobacter koreensis]|uniref:Duplicated orphan permease n=1 Tax=Parapedobacter koreensis TaxID=332977 RepID=A0A1H7QXQ3_9SPHI|nr:ABC transporter permease [Parapedobacter koreensis]SEL52425.1 duplicated orphan permease [Parapedobacter koreensis]